MAVWVSLWVAKVIINRALERWLELVLEPLRFVVQLVASYV